MSLERLWAGWRATYVNDVAVKQPGPASDCLFERLAAADDDDAMVLARTDRAFALMNAYPYTSGHLMVVPFEHVVSLAELSREDAATVMALVQDACTAMQEAYEPDGINVGVNIGRGAGAGIPGHVHVHVLPRWNGDTNFMTAIAEARVLPEPLGLSYDKLRKAWPR